MIDESSRPHCGYSEAGSGICGKFSKKKKFSNGGQLVMCMDIGRLQIRAYIYIHKQYNHRKQGSSTAGPN